jgi:hypothetical protein
MPGTAIVHHQPAPLTPFIAAPLIERPSPGKVTERKSARDDKDGETLNTPRQNTLEER